MKQFTWIGLIPLLASLFGSVAPSAPAKRALIIGVHDYSATDGKWDNLQSDKDAALIVAGLKTYFEFKDNDIRVLTKREETTRAAILKAIEDVLIAPAQPGDAIYLHYSGHGYQTEDESGDEPDFLDEVLVPSDGTGRKNYILDDEISALLEKLKAKGVTNVTLSFDCCNSGSNTRGIERTRGQNFPAFGEKPVPRSRGNTKDSTLLTGKDATGYVVLQATAPNEEARETEDGGRLTVALVETWRKAASTGTRLTYRELFERSSESIARLYKITPQRPQIEGDIDRYLFDLSMARPAPYFPIRVDDESVVVMAGEVHGATVGTKVAIFPAGTTNFETAKPITTATITEVRIDQARLTVPEGVNPEALSSTRGIITEYGQNSGALRLFVDPPAEGIRAALRTVLAIDMMSASAESYDLKLTRGATGFVIEQPNGAMVAQIPANGQEDIGVRDALRNIARWNLVRRLENPAASTFGAEIRVVRVKTEPDPSDRSRVRFAGFEAESTSHEFRKGDHFALQVKAEGDINPFIAVLDLLPDGTVTQLWPVQARDMKVPTTGEWYWLSPSRGFLKVGTEAAGAKIDIYEIDPAHGGTGVEAFKLMVTKEFVDYGGLVSGDPAATRGAKSPLELLLAAYGTGTRAKSVSAPPKDWATASASITVVKD